MAGAERARPPGGRGPSRRGLLTGALALAVPGVARGASADLVLSNARILVGDGTELRGGVHIVDGSFAEVGPDVKGGVDLEGQVLFPGFYEAGSPLGLWEVDLEAETHDDAESSEAVVPHARVVDAYNALSEVVAVQRSAGVVGCLVVPAGGSLVPGQAAWLRTTTSADVREAVLQAPAGVCFSLGHGATGGVSGSPKSRMGVAAKIRDLFEANPLPPPEPEDPPKKRSDRPKEPHKQPQQEPPKPPTALQRAVHALLRRETKAIFYAERADDLLLALELARTYGLDAVLLGAAEGHLVARALADAGHPLLLGPVTVQPDSFEHLHASYENAALLHAAGARLALRVGSPHNARTLGVEAGIAAAYGLPPATALAAVSGLAPSFWGLKTGMIRAGHRATCVRTDGDPLQPATRVRNVWIDGVEIALRDHQTELYERFRDLR